ncbi:hypothetical protein BayCH28_11825 [Mycolicibacterium sp. CH28]|uniref:hypothetical protein n=1 Tax=Mycolicibacterium sp. CH28 TaxID=2512237 RepID=UPI001080EFB9|nr:hypothetical protein [Mycolicibacterium sp. CH28]TGD88413.1 hypothetical protein BayCH28_11825 [Mycolicibacterium sp. CH28]
MFRYLLALNPVERNIQRIDIRTGDSSVVVGGLTAVPDGIAVDVRRRHAYWTNMGEPVAPTDRSPTSDSELDFYGKNGSLERVDLDGTHRTTIIPQGSFVTGKQLVGAWSQGRLYWSDREGARVLSARLDGTDLRDEVVVATTDADRRIVRNQCVGVAVDEEAGLLYWTQKGASKGNDGRIFRTSLRTPIFDRVVEELWSDLPEPIDLHLDVAAGLVYWTDRGAPPRGNTLNRAPIPPPGTQGADVTVLARDFREPIGLAVDTDAGLAYVGDLSGEVRAVELDGTGERRLVRAPGGFTGIAGI